MFNYSELKNHAAVLAQRSGDTTYEDDKIGIWINLSLEFLYGVYDYFPSLEDTHNFTSVDGTENYYMPKRFNKPMRIKDLTNDKEITILTEYEYVDSNVSNIADSTEGVPDVARFYGVKGIGLDISSSGTIVKVKSSSATETTAVVVRVEGFVDSSRTILDFENITVPTTASSTFVSGTKTFYDIIHVSKDRDSDGYITVANSADTTLTILSSIERVSEHRVLKLGLIPDASTYSYRIWFKKKFTKLVNANDYPFVEADDFIIFNTAKIALAQDKETMERANQYDKWAKEALNILLTNLQGKHGPSYQHKITNVWANAHRS